MRTIKRIFTTLLLLAAVMITPVTASHVVGSDISYACTSTPGVFDVTVIIYRDCSGVPLCSGTPCNGCSLPANYSPSGVKVTCGSTSLGTISMSLVSVVDVNIDPLCPLGKSICTNCGTVTAGSYTPGVEKYTFTGSLDTRSFPSSCCTITLSWELCCRNGAISTGSSGQNFYIESTLNKCVTPCNSSPVLSNDPFAVICGGQPYTFNNGAIDPDGDSLSYEFTPSLQGAGSSVSYISPYSYDAPMPYYPPKTGPFPLGIHCDPLSGDISFTPSYGGGQFVGVMAVMVKQWRTINGVPTMIGYTRRDIQMWLITCPPNNPPRIMTNPSLGPNLPKLNWVVCSGNTLCFDVIGKDTDFLPFNNPPISDTTYLSWNNALTPFGATFNPKYNVSQRKILGPREDIYQFCWTPTDAMARTLPYFFTVKARDTRCPNPGQTTRSISITVLEKAKVSIVKNPLRCGKWSIYYTKNKPSQQFSSVVWNISRVPNDYSMTNVYTYINVQYPPTLYFPIGGKYLVELDINTPGPVGEGPCQAQFFDTLTVDTVVQPFVNDTFVCKGNSITIPYYARWGTPPYAFRWFIYPDTFLFPQNGPFYGALSFTTTPTSTVRYILQVRDIYGCRNYDTSEIVTVKQLPTFIKPDSALICFGSSYTMNLGNDGGIAKKYLWSSGDTTQSISKKDSGQYILQIVDSFWCVNQDTFTLLVNPYINANAGNDTSICAKDSTKLRGSGGTLYQWRNLSTNLIIKPKDSTNSVSISPTTNTKYEVRVFQTVRGLECSNVDTVSIVVKPLPILTRPQPLQVCKSSHTSFLPSFINNQMGGVGVWSYKNAISLGNKISLDSLSNLPLDSVNYSTGFDNWVKYKYTSPTSYGGCTSYDSVIVRVFGDPYVNLNPITLCKNDVPFKLQNNPPTWTLTPYDATGQNVIWIGNGISKIAVGNNFRYEFDPRSSAVLSSNLITYKYSKQYLGVGSPSCTGQDTATFRVKSVPVITMDSINPICDNSGIFLISDKSNAYSSSGGKIFWTYYNPQFGINIALPDSETFNPSKVTITSNSYTWRVVANDISTGCSVRDTIGITVIKSPSVNLSIDSIEYCKGYGNAITKLTTNPSGGLGVWYSNPPSSYDNNVFKTDTSGSYRLMYKYTIQYLSYNCSNIDTVNVIVIDPPTISVTAKDAGICVYDTIYNLTVSSNYPKFWLHSSKGRWVNNDSTSYSISLIKNKMDSLNTHIVVSTKKINACPTIKDSIDLIVYPKPNAQISCSNCNGCEPLTSSISSVVKSNSYIYRWYMNNSYFGSDDSYPDNRMQNWGKYDIKLVVSSIQGCLDTGYSLINVYSIPNAKFTSEPSVTTIARPFFNFINMSTNIDGSNMFYLWSIDGKDYTDKDLNEIRYSTEGVKLIKLRVVSEEGCVDTTSGLVTINPDITVFIPNAFHPGSVIDCQNGDPECNRTFKPAASGYQSIEIYIFNRWGQQVYHATNINEGWNGKINNNGEFCTQDVYIYQVNAVSYSGKSYRYSGSITLLR